MGMRSGLKSIQGRRWQWEDSLVTFTQCDINIDCDGNDAARTLCNLFCWLLQIPFCPIVTNELNREPTWYSCPAVQPHASDPSGHNILMLLYSFQSSLAPSSIGCSFDSYESSDIIWDTSKCVTEHLLNNVTRCICPISGTYVVLLEQQKLLVSSCL